jgi:hypothetical protein
VASPILSSIYLHKLDQFVETVLIPEYTRGGRRARNPAYLDLQNQLAKARRRGDRPRARALRRRMVSLPSADPDDPGYRRLRYCRYADHYLLAGDVYRLHRLRWVMETSMLKTLAGKHRSTVSKMAAKHKARIQTPHGPRTCFEARIERDGRQPLVARFGETLNRPRFFGGSETCEGRESCQHRGSTQTRCASVPCGW